MAIMEIRLLADKAVAEGLDKDTEFQRRMAFLQQRALHSELIDKDVGAKITDEEVRARYDKQMADTPPVNEVKARHILVKTKEEADAIIKQLEGGADFQKLANEHTTDPSGKTQRRRSRLFRAGPDGAGVREGGVRAGDRQVHQRRRCRASSAGTSSWSKTSAPSSRRPSTPSRTRSATSSSARNISPWSSDLRKAAKVDVSDPELKKAVDAMDAAAK